MRYADADVGMPTMRCSGRGPKSLAGSWCYSCAGFRGTFWCTWPWSVIIISSRFLSSGLSKSFIRFLLQAVIDNRPNRLCAHCARGQFPFILFAPGQIDQNEYFHQRLPFLYPISLWPLQLVFNVRRRCSTSFCSSWSL